MLRITTTREPDAICLKLEGRLVGPWVDELAQVWRSIRLHPDPVTACVDLSGITFVSPEGRQLLAFMARGGARFPATDVMNRSIIAGLCCKLPPEGGAETSNQ